MEEEPKVFSSNITRSAKPLKNNLFDLLQTVPAQPVEQRKNEKRGCCNFQPRNDKHFEPKKKTKYKVKTVRDIRNSFEKEIYSSLPAELEKQQNVLFRKIRAGTSRDENTKTLAKNILKCDEPITRSAWQMLMNLNPEDYANSTQFVLWNGTCIQVNGSKGGKLKFICKYDLGVKNLSTHTSKVMKRKLIFKRKGLLRNSLSIDFKPGPLTKKRILDNSYQKYHVGGIELLDLPMPCLEINPALGETVDPTIAHFLYQMRQVDGTISNKWAEFSASVLATVKDKNIISVEEESSVTFNLSYKCDQQRILMRRDASSDINSDQVCKTQVKTIAMSENSILTSEIQNLLDKMLDSVEISINQDIFFTGEDQPRVDNTEDINSNGTHMPVKDRLKRRYGELERLDVTIIRLSESPEINTMNTCQKPHCSLGCVCASLQCSYYLKSHCGRKECMFECNCDFSKYKVVDSLERDCSEIVPGLVNIDNEIFSKMAKEEQKFHQTVIVTSENSMLLKSKRRHWKSSKKYADFYSNMCLKAEKKTDKVLEVVLQKLNLENVEPWCMIHNLYKCFCKGRFTDHYIPEVITDDINIASVNNSDQQIKVSTTENQTKKIETNTVKYYTRMNSASSNKVSQEKPYHYNQKAVVEDYDTNIINDGKSARTTPFTGRKYTDDHYCNANKKIMEMEEHDNTLRNRMLHLINMSASKSAPNDQNIQTLSEVIVDTDTNETSKQSKNNVSSVGPSDKASIADINVFSKRPDKEHLVAWLETSYKNYRKRVDQGIVKISLDPPKLGKMALYPWEFILSRYRDQKNLFLISKQPQYRIFMAVDTKNPFFDNCININDIRFADLHKYPITVKNLLTNAKDLKDNFCILCGLSSCWELIGSVTKICDRQEITKPTPIGTDDDKNEFRAMSTDGSEIDSEDSVTATSAHGKYSEEDIINTDSETTINDQNTTTDSSKWFVMTVENDFDEIQFYNKGFFVKLESIIKAINVARASGKTVRLSSQKCFDNSGPQFGIYAIPNENESCVFVGPYEKDELLGIETVKKNLDKRKQNRTRGVWITTKKLENFNVIDNPLSFMPPKNAPVTEMMSITGQIKEKSVDKELLNQTSKDSKITPTKPIKIRKTNGFYQLAPNGTLKQIPVQQIHLQNPAPISSDNCPRILNTASTTVSDKPHTSSITNITPNISATVIPIHKKPVAEIAPHVKISNKTPDSLLKKNNNCSTKKERGSMFILKPEEINKRVMENHMPINSEMKVDTHDCAMNSTNDQEIELDIESFLATATECVAPNDDVLIISDDENESLRRLWQDVWIECKTVESLGYIPGRRNKEGLLSFEFPGFKYTEFYRTEDAYAKLNQVLSRKIYIPKNIILEWHVIDSHEDLGVKQMLRADDLGPDFVMTKRGIRHKQDLANSKFLLKNQIATESVYSDSTAGENSKEKVFFTDKPKDCIEDLEAASQLLESEREILWNKLTSSSDNSEALDNLREQIAARLQNMVSDT